MSLGLCETAFFGSVMALTHWPLGDFKLILVGNFQANFSEWWLRYISYEVSLRWMPLDLTNDKSTLVQVMAWCRQATSHYLIQCWPRSMSPNGVTRPQWVNDELLTTHYLNQWWQSPVMPNTHSSQWVDIQSVHLEVLCNFGIRCLGTLGQSSNRYQYFIFIQVFFFKQSKYVPLL